MELNISKRDGYRISRLVDKKLMASSREGDRKHSKLLPNEFYISSAGLCSKYIHLSKLHNYSHPPKMLRRFLLGNLLHEYIQDLFKEEYPESEIEYPIRLKVPSKPEDILLRGRADIKTDKAIIELKSIAKLPSKPLKQHMMQLTLYMAGCGLKEGYLYYFGKSGGENVSFHIPYSKELFDETVSIFKSVYLAHLNNFIPPGIHTFYCRECLEAENCVLSGM